MAVTIDATNMVEIDDADQTTGWTSSMGGLNTVTLAAREGSPATALQDQASETTYEVYHTITSEDYTDRTIFGWMRSGGPASEGDATGAGFAMYLDDGTDEIAYDVGGSDNFGFFFAAWSSFRLNTAGLPTDFRVIAGVEANLTLTAITEIGYGGHFPGKAAGNADNVQFDILRYVANANPALLIEGGTTGDRGTFAEIVTADEALTAAWGIARVLIGGSKAYQIQFGIQIGSLDADAFFEDSDFQLYLNGATTSGGTISAGSMDVDCVGDSGSTNACNLDNFFIQSIGEVSNWTMSADLDEAEWTNGQFVDLGTFTFPAQDAAAKFLTNIIFVNCGQVDPNTLDMDEITFNGTSDATGALLLDENQSGTQNITDATFVSDGTGYGVRIRPTGAGPFTYNFDNWQNSGYGADDTANAFVDVDPVTSTADITINLLNGSGTITVDDTAHTGTLTIVNAVTVGMEGMTEGSAAKIIADETAGTITQGDVIMEAFADSAGVAEITDFNYEAAFGAGLDVIVRARNQGILVAAIRDQGPGSFSRYETEAASSGAGSVFSLISLVASLNDAAYFGHTEQFGRMKLDMGTGANAGTGTINWEYWDGLAWSALTGVSDDTVGWTVDGIGDVSWTIPGDWATTSVDGTTLYYVRGRLNPVGTAASVSCQTVTVDATRYLPFPQTGVARRTITDTGLTVRAVWVEDTIAQWVNA